MNTLNNINYNPDILNCLSSLSNDEVFTPPKVVHQMLDMLPQEIWQTQEAAFLDPCTKSGIFLREIVKRLVVGLKPAIPNLEERVNHILHRQVFGIAVTELTALLARRTVYCSKKANAELSIARLATAQGNIIFNGTKHWWNKDGQCKYCGANQQQYDRGDGLEAHAYQFIHTKEPQNLFINAEGKPVKFDVIIGNPPYQMADGGAQESAKPLYHKFISQAKKLKPRYLSMIIPARWYAGGKGLDAFRNEMLNDNCLSVIHDFPETSDVFSGINIRGGICYFLWQREKKDNNCEVFNHQGHKVVSDTRPLLENNANIFIRYNQAISILRKVQSLKEKLFFERVSSRNPFGFATNYSNFTKNKTEQNTIKLYRFGQNGFINQNIIERNNNLISLYKVLVPKASPGGDSYPHQVLTYPTLAEPQTCCTETYIILGAYSNKTEAENVISYVCTKFFRFLIILIKNTQDVTKKVYQFIPQQDFSKPWTDEELYKKYDITKEEQDFITTLVRPMEIKINSYKPMQAE